MTSFDASRGPVSEFMSIVSWWQILCRLKLRGRLLGAALLVVAHASAGFAQSIPLLGYAAAKNADPKRLEAFKQGLTDLGYVEGRTVRIDYREAVLDDEYQGVMAALLQRKVGIILAANAPAAVAAARATTTTPIGMLAGNAPEGSPR